MTNKKISDALQFLNPEAEWSLVGDDLANLLWLDNKQPRPKDSEILETINNLEAIKAQVASEALAAKTALLEKLGITEEEAKLLLS